jgi:hypothetical protein
MLGWVFAIGIFLALLVLDALLGGCTGALVGLVCWLLWRRGPWQQVIPFDMLLGSAGFAVAEMGALVAGSLRDYIPRYLGPEFVAPIMSVYNHNFRAGFVGAIVVPVLYELYRAAQPKAQ